MPFFGLSGTFGALTVSGITGLTQCLQANSAGVVTGTGSPCGGSPSPTRAGDIIYYNGTNWVTLAGNNSGTQVLEENSSGSPSWTVSASGTVTSITGGQGCVSGTGGQTAITTSGTIYCAPGSANKLRNSSLTAWSHGCVSAACTITTSGGWCAEGVYLKPTGASITCQQTQTCPTGALTYNCLKVTSAPSVTEIVASFVVESYDATPLAGVQTTFQFRWLNNCGSSVTPAVSATYPTAQDNYTSTGSDLSSATMTATASSATQLEAYSWSASSSIKNGDSVDVSFGTCGASGSDSFTIAGGFDWRATPGVSTGIPANPPAPEIRDAFSDIAWNQRFFQCSYDNGILPGTSTTNGPVSSYYYISEYVAFTIPLQVTMRTDPTFGIWDVAGNSGKVSSYVNGTRTDNVTLTATIIPATKAVLFVPTAGGGSGYSVVFHYCVDATVTGA